MILVWTLLPLAATPPLPFQEPEPVTEEPQDPLLPCRSQPDISTRQVDVEILSSTPCLPRQLS